MELQVYLWLLLLIISVTTIKITLGYKRNKKLPPGLYKLPIIGNLHQLMSAFPHRKMRELAQKHGYTDLMHLKLGHVDHIVVLSAEAAKEIMTTHDLNFASRPCLLAPSIIGYDNLSIAFAPYGSHWRQMRKLCMLELLSPRRVKASFSVRKEEITNLVRDINSESNSVINLTKKLVGLAAMQISRAAFGAKFNQTERFMKVAKRAIELTSGFNLADIYPSFPILGTITGMRQSVKAAHKVLDEILSEIVEENQQRRRGKKTEDIGNEGLLDIILSMYNDQNPEYQLSISMVKSVIFDMIIGGTETTSTTLAWVMVELVRHPEIMKKVQSEIRSVLRGKGNRDIEEEDLRSMRYMKQVLMETLRMYPPLPLLIPRECAERCSIMGYSIPSGSRIMVNAWSIGRDERYWEDGESFKPERFDEEFKEVDYLGTKQVGYLSFGGGRRVCPGMTFGMDSIELVLAHLLFHFDWKLPDGINPDDLDMTESAGSSVARKDDLFLIAQPYQFPDLPLGF